MALVILCVSNVFRVIISLNVHFKILDDLADGCRVFNNSTAKFKDFENLFFIFRFWTNPDRDYKLPKQDNLQDIYFMLLMKQTVLFH